MSWFQPFLVPPNRTTPQSQNDFVRGHSSDIVTYLTFDVNLRTSDPWVAPYFSHQQFLYDTVSDFREKGWTFQKIADWLNKEGYLTVRGRTFRGTHVHSILRKRLAKEELLRQEYPPVWSDFSTEVVDKTILMSDFGFSN